MSRDLAGGAEAEGVTLRSPTSGEHLEIEAKVHNNFECKFYNDIKSKY